MFRARIGFAAAALIAAVTALCALAVGSMLRHTADRRMAAQITRAQATFPTLDLLRGIELTNETARFAREDELGAIFEKPTVEQQRQMAFVAVQARNARLDAEGKKADLVAVVGANGHVISRDLNMSAMYDEDLKSEFPSVGKALDGIANKDVWLFDGHMYRVGAAPIRSKSGALVGALVIGYVASAREAMVDKGKLGTDVAYFLNGKVEASSFAQAGGESREEKDLAAQLFGADNDAAFALSGGMSKPFRLQIAGEEYLAAAGPLTGNITASKSGFVVLAPMGVAYAGARAVLTWILFLGIVGLIAAVGAAVATALRFIRPLDAIERGVAEVINGNHEYMFESPGRDFEGLANGLNVMLARLTGRPDPSDDELADAGGARWGGDLAVDNQATGPHMSPENVALASEPESEYFPRLYEEYLTARKQTGEGVEGLTLDDFMRKIRANEQGLKQKYDCRAVRFKVVVKNKQTTLKPVPII